MGGGPLPIREPERHDVPLDPTPRRRTSLGFGYVLTGAAITFEGEALVIQHGGDTLVIPLDADQRPKLAEALA